MIRLRTLIATALLTIPMLAVSAAAPTREAGAAASHAASAPPGCYYIPTRGWLCV